MLNPEEPKMQSKARPFIYHCSQDIIGGGAGKVVRLCDRSPTKIRKRAFSANASAIRVQYAEAVGFFVAGCKVQVRGMYQFRHCSYRPPDCPAVR